MTLDLVTDIDASRAPAAATNQTVLLPTLAVLGTADRAARTTASARLVRGLKRAGLAVGAVRLSGRRSGHGYSSLVDAGAHPILDLGDQGRFPRVRGVRLGETAALLLERLAATRADVAVVELEQDLFNAGALKTLASEALGPRLAGVVLSAPDPAAAGYAAGWLRRWGVPVVAVSGKTAALRATRRETARLSGAPVLRSRRLVDPIVAFSLMFGRRSALGEPAVGFDDD